MNDMIHGCGTNSAKNIPNFNTNLGLRKDLKQNHNNCSSVQYLMINKSLLFFLIWNIIYIS